MTKLSSTATYYTRLFEIGLSWYDLSWIFESFSDATATATATTETTITTSASIKTWIFNLFPETPRETLEDHRQS